MHHCLNFWRQEPSVPGLYIESEPVVITGIGLITSIGNNREEVWQSLREGKSGIRRVDDIEFFRGESIVAATVNPAAVPNWEDTGALKPIQFSQIAAREAMQDAGFDFKRFDDSPFNADRVACAIAGHMGDPRWSSGGGKPKTAESWGANPWHEQWFPDTACTTVARDLGISGPRMCYSTACASSLIAVLSAVRAIRSGAADAAICGGGEGIDPMMAAGFKRMRALATEDDPAKACRPFDRNRSGFVLGEGGGVLFIERLSHALRRNARIYAEIAAGKVVAQAHHVTGVDAECDALEHLIGLTLRQSQLEPDAIEYINAHGTGTQQNDSNEIRGLRNALGPAADNACVSSTKAMTGHLVNAAGSLELAITALALRDGFTPPTINLEDPDPDCDMDCLPLTGRQRRCQHALKISIAFGGHLAATVLRRWNDAATGYMYPDEVLHRRAA